MTTHKTHPLDTRTRLLHAGGEIFAQNGFRGATVRCIAQQAQANVAAVNYHFTDKKGLYLAVIEYTFAAAQSKYPSDLGLGEEAGAPQRLHAFVNSVLLRILDEGRPAWHGKLIMREIADPSPVLDQVVEKLISPFYDQLMAIVGELLCPEASVATVRLSAMSIMGQCLFYRDSGPVVSRLHQGPFDAARIRQIAEHITAFSLRALQRQGAGEGGNQ